MTFRPVRRDLDEEPDPESEQPVCRCGGEGWVAVQPSYAQRLHPDPPPLPLDADDEQRALHEFEASSAAALRAEAANSVYPCRACLPQQFHRWALGHYRPDHRSCGACAG